MATILGVFAMTMVTTDDTLTINAKMPQLVGHMYMTVTGSDGNIKTYIQSDNIVTTAGLNCALVALFDPIDDEECDNNSESPFNVIVLGSNSTDGELVTDVSGDVSSVGNEVARLLADERGQDGNEISLNATFIAVAEGAGNILEAEEVVGETALFDTLAANSGNMLSRVTLPPTEVADGDEIFISWTITGNTP